MSPRDHAILGRCGPGGHSLRDRPEAPEGALSHSLDPGQRVGALREEWTGGLLRAGAPPPGDSTMHGPAGSLPRNWPLSRAPP